MTFFAALTALASLTGCTATDGDTVRCGDERVGLLGIDAPEFHCPQHRNCVEGEPQAARADLARLIRGRDLTIERIGQDRYGRTLGLVYDNGVSVSYAMVQASRAAYIEQRDNGRRGAKEC